MSVRPTAVLALAAALMASACANQQPTRTGFLDQAAPTVMRGTVNAGEYRAFVIDEVAFHPAPDAVQNPGGDDVAALLGAYRAALDTAFATRFARAEAAGPGVLQVRAAVTGYARANVPLNVLATALVGPVSNGGAAAEAEVLDSVTGQRIASLADAHNEHLFTAGPFAYYRGLAMAERALGRMAQTLAAQLPVAGGVQAAGR